MELKITSFSPAADKLFYRESQIEAIAEGYRFTEGPVWDEAAGCLYFTDFQQDLIIRWTPEGGAKLYTDKSNRAIGLYLDAAGCIVSAESRSHGVAYVNDQGSELIVGKYEGKRLNSPNDVVVMRDGDICFTDPYSTAMGEPRELDFNGVYRVSPGGEIKLLIKDMGRPNGLAFSPDESVFYVNDTDAQHILAYSVHKDGSVSKTGVFATMDTSYGSGAPDGMKVDILGNVFVTGPGGIWIFAPDSAPIALLHSPEFVGNFCFGGYDGQTLYITASTSVYAVKIKSPGILPYRNKAYSERT